MTSAVVKQQDALEAHKLMANAIRALAMDAVEQANSGHPGMPMGMADVATVLYTQFLKYNPAKPEWPDRDRLVLSAGHGSMLLYALLHLTGYEDMTIEEIKRFRQLGSKTAGHPEYGHAAGIETTTGPLGQGLGNAVGMAIAERILAARFGDELVDHTTYCIAGDGCLMEGISQEAISLAGHLKLSKLIVLFDDNGISIDGPTSLSTSEDHLKRFEACGWDVARVDGHDAQAIAAAIAAAKKTNTPSLIACKTTIAYGAPTKAGSEASHGAALGKDEIAGTRKNLSWEWPAFEVPEAALSAWRTAGRNHQSTFQNWEKRLSGSPKRQEFLNAMEGALGDGWKTAIAEAKKKLIETPANEATRKSSQRALDVLAPQLPGLVGGSADLTGSNNTLAKGMKVITKDHFSGHYLHYGIREHGMAAAMNGMALHGGIIPYGATFLVFTDYCRPSIRLSALMGQRVVYVMTHDSIGVGEDGPTHQPVEHLAALRAIPNLYVFRPCDAVETLECWEQAIRMEGSPSVLVLTRQNLPQARLNDSQENLSAKGGYVVSESEGAAQATLLATGSEVSVALAAQKLLKKKGIAAKVVSMVCWELFDAQPERYRKEVLGEGVKVAVEAALSFGWERYLGEKGAFVGMKGFGASAPAPELYKHFGITAEAVASAVQERLK